MQQIWVLHGGDAFASYEEYLTNLKNWKVDINRLRGGHDWKSSLQAQLGNTYDVFLPSMPNSRNAKYIEWKIWFNKCVPFMEDGVVLVGHSLGGLFLAKYLGEEDFSKKVKATFLVAPPFDTDGERPIVEFDLPKSLDKLAAQGGKLFLYHSKDDPVVAFSELAKYRQTLPHATVRIFDDRGHFNQGIFLEIVGDIQSL